MRNELSGLRTRKIYFYDIGVRNALINNYNDIDLRVDAGGIWENFCIVELKKKAQRERKRPRFYFWRTVSGSEIDLLEEENGEFNVYEFKLSDKKKAKIPKGFAENYTVKSFNVINKENWFQYF
jgi:predicted AAA+ superfamily ATPase